MTQWLIDGFWWDICLDPPNWGLQASVCWPEATPISEWPNANSDHHHVSSELNSSVKMTPERVAKCLRWHGFVWRSRKALRTLASCARYLCHTGEHSTGPACRRGKEGHVLWLQTLTFLQLASGSCENAPALAPREARRTWLARAVARDRVNRRAGIKWHVILSSNPLAQRSRKKRNLAVSHWLLWRAAENEGAGLHSGTGRQFYVALAGNAISARHSAGGKRYLCQ